MKAFFQRFDIGAKLRRKRVVVPALVALAVLVAGSAWYSSHSGVNAVLNEPATPISVVLDRADNHELAAASITGQRIIITDKAGVRSWTIEKDSAMGATEQILRAQGVRVSVQSTDDLSLTTMLPNLLGLLVLQRHGRPFSGEELDAVLRALRSESRSDVAVITPLLAADKSANS